MRILFTLFLIALAAALCVAAVRETTGEGKSWLGSRSLPKGSPIASFSHTEVAHITLSKSTGESITLERANIGWEIHGDDSTPSDRADANRLTKLIDFTLNSRVIDFIPRDDIQETTTGLGPQAIRVALRDQQGDRLAEFLIGRKSPWVELSEDGKESTPTVYVRHIHQPLKNTVYVCSDPTKDIQSLFLDRFSTLRDPRPFFFNPNALTHIRLKNKEGEIILNRPDLNQAWTIDKPLELKTDPAAVKNLIESLVKLRATEINETATTAPSEATAPPLEIAISSIGSTKETILSIAPPAPNSQTTTATTNDRSAVFTLALNSGNGLIGVNSIPLTLNGLRYKKLTSIDPKALKSVAIESPGKPPILLSRETPRSYWQVFTDKGFQPTNDFALFDLFSSITKEDVVDFASDAAVDLSPYGLDSPIVSITLSGFQNTGILLKFGKNAEGKIFAKREGEPNVYEISPEVFSNIKIRHSKWRSLNPWNLSRVDVRALSVNRINETPLLLTYDFITENWTAAQNKKDVTADLLIPRANKFLEALEKLKAFNWLEPDDEKALTALKTPVFIVKLITDDGFGNTQKRMLTIARASESRNNQFFFAKLSNEQNPFILDLETIKQLATPLLEKK